MTMKPHNTQETAEARAQQLLNASNAQLRLQFGELTAQEIRTMRAALRFVVGKSWSDSGITATVHAHEEATK